MTRFHAVTAFARHASAVIENDGILGTMIKNNYGIRTARFRSQRKPR